MYIVLLAIVSAANAGSICNDGTVSKSSGRGTCSHHGGVSSAYNPPVNYSTSYKPSYSPPISHYSNNNKQSPPAQSLCADGTMSPSEGSGTCSHHGGLYKPPAYVMPKHPSDDYLLTGSVIVDLVSNKSGQEEWLGDLQDNSWSRNKKAVDPNAKNSKPNLYNKVDSTFLCYVKDSFGDKINYDCYEIRADMCRHPLEGTLVNTVAQYCVAK